MEVVRKKAENRLWLPLMIWLWWWWTCKTYPNLQNGHCICSFVYFSSCLCLYTVFATGL